MTELLWSPNERRRADAVLTRFVAWLDETRGLQFGDYEALWRWSVDDLEGFWAAVWQYFEVQQSTPHERVLADDRMPGARWFPEAQLNFAGHVLRCASHSEPAIIYKSEAAGSGSVSWAALHREVAACAAELRECGVQPGDRVVAYLPNIPQAVIAFLAVASIGAVWSICAPDMGLTSVIDRFRQIEPKVLITVDGYRFGGKEFDRRKNVAAILEALPSVTIVIQIPLLTKAGSAADAPQRRVLSWSDVVAGESTLAPLQVGFEHPLWVVYSSGTTGSPKAIVHSHGGALAIGLVQMGLHLDLEPGDRYFWYSSTGWIMWNLQVMGLLTGATICLYDGSVAGGGPQPDLMSLWRFVARHRINFFGAGAAYFATCLKADLSPCDFDLSSLQSIGSTGSPLSTDCYRWIYGAVKRDVWLGSMSGGTDIAGAFVTGTPTLPVYLGELQCRNLGAAVYAFNERGEPVYDRVGELVCTRPIPSMPVCFWGDDTGERYRESYFSMFCGSDGSGIWRHGDWIKLTRRQGVVGAVIYGRSDATINRHGIRMGTAEFYHLIEAHPDVLDSLVIDLEYLGRQSWLGVFVVMRSDITLDDAVIAELKTRIRIELSPRHVPDEILQVPAIPRTTTGKKLEIPVKRLLLGKPAGSVVNPGAVANPESLQWFVEFARTCRMGQTAI